MDDLIQVAFENFLKAQIKYFEESKWYEGEKRNSDPGDNYLNEEINKQAETFRRRWERSHCKDCSISWKCGNLLKTQCPEFRPI